MILNKETHLSVISADSVRANVPFSFILIPLYSIASILKMSQTGFTDGIDIKADLK
jgi:hypothetical protein